MRRLGTIAAVLVVCAAAVAARRMPGTQLDLGTSAFESYVELLRQQAGIPGISGVLLQEGTIVWERGLGMANLETRVRTTPDTPFYIADLSQMFSAVLLLQCVEESHLDLDDPVSRYGVKLPDAGATLRQVLSHQAPAGSSTAFEYDAERYSQLTSAVEYCAPQPYRKSIAHRLLERLAMIDSVPGLDMQNPAASPEGLFEPAALARYASSLQRMAVPYKVDKRGRATRSDLRVDGINAATGLVSTARDLAQFDKALDSRFLLRENTLDAAWSPALTPAGIPLPMGLGWFVQTYRGTRVVWHFGVVPNAYSALVVKVPSRRATMILLANSDGLANPFQLEAGDVTHSPFASILLRMLL